MANSTKPVADSNPSLSGPNLKVAGGTEFELLVESRPVERDHVETLLPVVSRLPVGRGDRPTPTAHPAA